jgi:tRNA pseudouridine55 synthase
MYSAKKIAGRKLYELARRGEEVERKPVRICVHEFSAIKPDGRLFKDNLDGTFAFPVHVSCSTGTYVRTLAEDFGKRLQVGAHLAELRRTRVGNFVVESAVTLEQLKAQFADDSIGTILVPPGAALPSMPFVHLTADDARKARHGMEVRVAEVEWSDGESIRICDNEGVLIAVGQYDRSKTQLHPRVVIAID